MIPPLRTHTTVHADQLLCVNGLTEVRLRSSSLLTRSISAKLANARFILRVLNPPTRRGGPARDNGL